MIFLSCRIGPEQPTGPKKKPSIIRLFSFSEKEEKKFVPASQTKLPGAESRTVAEKSNILLGPSKLISIYNRLFRETSNLNFFQPFETSIISIKKGPFVKYQNKWGGKKRTKEEREKENEKEK